METWIKDRDKLFSIILGVGSNDFGNFNDFGFDESNLLIGNSFSFIFWSVIRP